jgi:hypothetical protein
MTEMRVGVAATTARACIVTSHGQEACAGHRANLGWHCTSTRWAAQCLCGHGSYDGAGVA